MVTEYLIVNAGKGLLSIPIWLAFLLVVICVYSYDRLDVLEEAMVDMLKHVGPL